MTSKAAASTNLPSDLAELAPRMREVVLRVLEEHIESALPVASASVARRTETSISAATVRATMGELTEMGLLSQPHSSAGRVPTDRAFRLYVDDLMGRVSAHSSLPPGVGCSLTKPTGDVDDFMRRTADLLSQATGQLGFLLSQVPDGLPLRHVHFLRVSSERLMVLLVTQGGGVQTRIIDEPDSDQRTLDAASTRLSELVAGCTLAEARARLASAIEREREQSDGLWRKAFSLGRAGLSSALEAELYVGDRNLLLAHPEFSDVDRLRQVLCALEEKERMMRLLDKIVHADVLSVVIGSELEDPSIRGCAVVTAPLGDLPHGGGLGIIGPVRMRYAHVIPIVRYLSEHVSHCIA